MNYYILISININKLAQYSKHTFKFEVLMFLGKICRIVDAKRFWSKTTAQILQPTVSAASARDIAETASY